MDTVKGFLVAITLWFAFALLYNQAYANVTMDVDKWIGSSGTYKCQSVRECYTIWLQAEMRGETYYCNSVSIKRDGKIVWFRNYYR